MIIAVDFDGILCEDEFPAIGKPNYEMISFTRELIDKGHEVILWTSRADNRLTEAVDWCHDRGLHFAAVNENAPSNRAKYEKDHPRGTRKVYADIYIDDHDPYYFGSAEADGSWVTSYLISKTKHMINRLEKEEENGR